MTPLRLTIERPAYGNVSIARQDGKIVMIKGAAIPGEVVEADCLKEKKDYITASLKKVLQPSPDRIAPACEHFGLCGGCHLQHLDYANQVNLKEDILTDCLERLAKIEIDLSPSVINNRPWHYRLRGQFKVSGDSIGFYREASREIVSIKGCPIMAEEINHALERLGPLIRGRDIKEVHLTTSGPVIALIKTSDRNMNGRTWKKLATAFLEAGFAGGQIESAGGGSKNFGKSSVQLKLEGLTYMISPMSFFQSNWSLNEMVVNTIKESLPISPGDRILDLYAGAGNFSLPFAEKNRVVAVEGNPHAIEDGVRNLRENSIGNCTFVRSTAETYSPGEYFNILILDPPRPGLTNSAMENVLSLLPEQIVYISCNPTTFARDLKKLSTKYSVASVRLIDFFPQTYHIESMALLQLK